MINNNEYKEEKIFSMREVKTFLKASKGHKYEVFFKLILAYELSRPELLFLEWKDIDFENDTITICPISLVRTNQFYYSWISTKHYELSRELPLLPNIKKLLLELKEQQTDIQPETDYICLKENRTRLNVSRNLRYIARDNGLPQILLSGLRQSLDEFICMNSRSYDYYRAWTRFDCIWKGRNDVYGDTNLKRNKKFLEKLNNLIAADDQHSKQKSDMEMWGAIWIS